MSFRAVPGTQIGDYVVVSEIGRGGMAIVYLAERDPRRLLRLAVEPSQAPQQSLEARPKTGP
jgi:hypothetical protein